MEEDFSKMISSRAKALKDQEDYEEEDVWAVLKEIKDSSLKVEKGSSSSACRLPAVPRVTPRSVNSGSYELLTHQSSSAPLNIPDWSKIYNKKNISDINEANFDDADQDDDDDEEEEGMIPPHEFIARRLARSPIVSFSMCEGVGRTLKGRDLSKTRNAILTKTGFLE